MLYALVAVWAAWTRRQYGAIPFLLLFVLGFGIVAGSGVWQALRRLRMPMLEFEGGHCLIGPGLKVLGRPWWSLSPWLPRASMRWR